MIQYQLANNSILRLSIYNLLGQEVRTLVTENQASGSYLIVWDGKNDGGESVTSGIYLFTLKTGESFTETENMVLLR